MNMEGITQSENNELKPDALARLKMIVLSDLPKAKRIWTDDSLKWPSLESIKTSMCQMLTRLHFNNENAINLDVLKPINHGGHNLHGVHWYGKMMLLKKDCGL